MKELAKRLLLAKEAEAAAKAARLEAETALIAAFGVLKDEGTTTKTDGFYKVSVTTKINRELDYDAYSLLSLPDQFQFVELKPSIVMKKLRIVEAVDPAIVALCVTSKPAKPTVKIEEVTE